MHTGDAQRCTEVRRGGMYNAAVDTARSREEYITWPGPAWEGCMRSGSGWQVDNFVEVAAPPLTSDSNCGYKVDYQV